MALQVITPSYAPNRGGGQTEKKQDFWDKLLKGLKIAESVTGAAVNVEKFLGQRQERQLIAEKEQALSDLSQGRLTEAGEKLALRTGSKVLTGDEQSTLYEKLRQDQLRDAAKNTGTSFDIERILTGKSSKNELQEAGITPEMIESLKVMQKDLMSHNLSKEDYESDDWKITIENGVAYANLKELPKLPDRDMRTLEGFERSIGENIDRARIEARRPVKVAVGRVRDPQDPQTVLGPTDLLVKKGNKQYAIMGFAPFVDAEIKKMQLLKKMGITGEGAKEISSIIDKNNQEVNKLLDLPTVATARDSYKDLINTLKAPDTGVGHVALIFKTIRNLDDKTGVKGGDMDILATGIAGGLPLSTAFQSLKAKVFGDLVNKYGITREELASVKNETDLKNLENKILAKLKSGELNPQGFLSAESVGDLKALNIELYKAARDRAIKDLEDRVPLARQNFSAKLRAAGANDERAIALMANQFIPSVSKIGGLVDDRELNKLWNKGKSLVTQKEAGEVLTGAQNRKNQERAKIEDEIIKLEKEKARRKEQNAPGRTNRVRR